VAARIVFDSGIPVTAIGLDLTLRISLTERELPYITQLPNGLGPQLEKQIRIWWNYLGVKHNHPHDPLAALAMVRPDFFSFQQCDIRAKVEQELAGRVERFANPNGNVRAAFDPCVNGAEQALWDYIAG
jgi:purine nucleosidase